MYETLKALMEIPGLSGSEERVTSWLEKKWSCFSKSISIDGIGNLVAHIGGKGPRLLIEAHSDEVGFCVNSITSQGFIRLAPVVIRPGERPSRDVFLIGHPALIQTAIGDVHGFFACETGHAVSPEKKEKSVLSWGDIFIDIGATSALEVREMGLQIGDPVVWNPLARRHRGMITGKAMDDRVGLAIMTEALQKLNPDALRYDVTFAATVQEEMGVIGAAAIARDAVFDAAISLEVGLSGDTPGVTKEEIPTSLGAGPILVHHDREVSYSKEIGRAIEACAKANKIPLQHAVFQRFATDGRELIKMGIPTALLAVPTRYTHSPFETAAESDMVEVERLLLAFMQHPVQ
jgi:tetrahedral aminopeptidase